MGDYASGRTRQPTQNLRPAGGVSARLQVRAKHVGSTPVPFAGEGFSSAGLTELAVRLAAGVFPIGWLGAATLALWRAQDPAAAVDTAPGGQRRLTVAPERERFTAVAQAARTQGLLGHWRDECFEVVVPSTAVPLFELERAAFRLFGLRSQAAQLVARRPDGAMWVARRSASKAIDPGLLDTLVGGGVAVGETPWQTLLREAQEEAGIAPALLADAHSSAVFEVLRRVPQGVQYELVHVFQLSLPNAWQPVNADGEVAEFLCLTPVALARALRDGLFSFEAAESIAALQGFGP